jgi:hypothetical protein
MMDSQYTSVVVKNVYVSAGRATPSPTAIPTTATPTPAPTEAPTFVNFFYYKDADCHKSIHYNASVILNTCISRSGTYLGFRYRNVGFMESVVIDYFSDAGCINQVNLAFVIFGVQAGQCQGGIAYELAYSPVTVQPTVSWLK